MCVIAKKFPRDQERAFNKIITSCKRISLAECATYVYPKGGTQVTGPSIRLAECLAQNWGNLDFGIVELEQRNGESTVMAYAWDLETGTRQTKIFTVKHERRVGKGEKFRIDRLTDPRDIYEMTANQGARRLRSCILGVIPGDIVDAAVDECDRTLKSGGKNEPLIDRVRRMVGAFGEQGVTTSMIEKRLGHNMGAIIEQELVMLRKIYTSIKDGMGKRDDYFEMATDGETLVEKVAAKPKGNGNGGKSEVAKSKDDDSNPELMPVTNPGAQLGIICTTNGFTFGDFVRACNALGCLADADSIPSFDLIPEADAKRLLKSQGGLITAMRAEKAAV